MGGAEDGARRREEERKEKEECADRRAKTVSETGEAGDVRGGTNWRRQVGHACQPNGACAGLREKRGERAAEKKVGRTGLSCWVVSGFSTGLGSFLVFFFPFLFLFQTPLKSILNSKEI